MPLEAASARAMHVCMCTCLRLCGYMLVCVCKCVTQICTLHAKEDTTVLDIESGCPLGSPVKTHFLYTHPVSQFYASATSDAISLQAPLHYPPPPPTHTHTDKHIVMHTKIHI